MASNGVSRMFGRFLRPLQSPGRDAWAALHQFAEGIDGARVASDWGAVQVLAPVAERWTCRVGTWERAALGRGTTVRMDYAPLRAYQLRLALREAAGGIFPAGVRPWATERYQFVTSDEPITAAALRDEPFTAALSAVLKMEGVRVFEIFPPRRLRDLYRRSKDVSRVRVRVEGAYPTVRPADGGDALDADALRRIHTLVTETLFVLRREGVASHVPPP
jgi:hypothetical protein